VNQPKVSVIIPTLNEILHIEGLLNGILAQDYPPGKREFLILDGMSTDGTREVVSRYEDKFPEIQMIDNQGVTAPKALNIGIQKSTGEVVIRMDAHCKYPPHYISTLVNQLYSLKADNVGAAWRTIPGAPGTIPLAISIGMAHKFGVGNSDFRTGTTEIKEVDTVPFGCYRRDVFERIGLFDEELTRNQDDEFNARLIRSGGKIFLIGHLRIDYFARETLKKAADMFFQYGLFKPLVNKKLGSSATLRQFAPPLFVCAWLAVFIWAFFSPVFPFFPLISLLLSYFVPSFFFGVQAALRKRKPVLIILLPFVFAAFHFAYGLGYWKGIFLFYLFSQKSPVSVNSNR